MQSSIIMILAACAGFTFSHGQAFGEEGATDVSLLQYTLDVQEQAAEAAGGKGDECHGYNSRTKCEEGLICEDPKKPGVDVNSCSPGFCKCAPPKAAGGCNAYTNEIVCPRNQCTWNVASNACEQNAPPPEIATNTTTTEAPPTPAGYDHVGSHGMCTDNALKNWNEGIEVGQHSRSRQATIQLCADRCDATPQCNGFVYWAAGAGGSCDNCCRTYGACDTMRNNNHHEYVGSDAFVKAMSLKKGARVRVVTSFESKGFDGLSSKEPLAVDDMGTVASVGDNGNVLVKFDKHKGREVLVLLGDREKLCVEQQGDGKGGGKKGGGKKGGKGDFGGGFGGDFDGGKFGGGKKAKLCGDVVASSCNSRWADNYFGIELSTYQESKQLFVSGNTIVAGGVTYYVDAIQHHGNCNSNVGLVYVANDKSCADGTPWVNTPECGFGGKITTPLSPGDQWCLELSSTTPNPRPKASPEAPSTCRCTGMGGECDHMFKRGSLQTKDACVTFHNNGGCKWDCYGASVGY